MYSENTLIGLYGFSIVNLYLDNTNKLKDNKFSEKYFITNALKMFIFPKHGLTIFQNLPQKYGNEITQPYTWNNFEQ